MSSWHEKTRRSGKSVEEFDAVIIGVGFAGLYAIHRLRDTLGLSVKAYELGDDVGGTWYWNRYPGARCDIESYTYSYSFSDELQQDWNWTERFASQPEILRYLQHVADRFDLRRDIQFSTRVTSGIYDEPSNCWEIRTDDGGRARAKFLISAVGNLSVMKDPAEFAGLETFNGKVYATGHWPHEGVDFTGQRVAAIGSGASGIQVIPEIAKQARHLTVFQRTPNYATPLSNAPVEQETAKQIKANYRQLREQARGHRGGLLFFGKVKPSALEVTEEERQLTYEERMKEGGFRLFLDSFADLLVSKEANDTAADFIRSMIRKRVDNPAIAELLTPKNHPYGTKRPPLETAYYETFNRDNVALIDLKSSPIVEITATGLRTTAGEHELDSIVLATGFDAITGPLLRLGMRGRNGLALEQKWAHGPRTYLGLAIHGFPNLFTITGPQSPSLLYNVPVAIEQQVDWVSGCIKYMQENCLTCIEPTLEHEDQWVAHVNELAEQTLLAGVDSWWTGANVPGKPRVLMVYVGGGPMYLQRLDDVASRGYEGFVLTAPHASSPGSSAI